MTTINSLKGMASSKLGFARSNNFMVELPTPIVGSQEKASGNIFDQAVDIATNAIQPYIPRIPGLIPGSEVSMRELNVLCKGASLPGKQILTSDRRIGMHSEKLAYGYAVAPVNLTFLMLNDYSVKTYFDNWLQYMMSDGYSRLDGGRNLFSNIKYKSEYAAKSVIIHQLRRPQIGFSGNIGPLNLNVGLGGGSVYTVELIEAFPTTIGEIQFSNELDGLVEITVEFSYTNWVRKQPSQNWTDLINI